MGGVGGGLYGPYYTWVGTTAAQYALHALPNAGFIGLGVFFEQGYRCDNHSVEAIAALGGLLLLEGLLHRMQRPVFLHQSFERGNRFIGGSGYRDATTG